MTSAKNVYTVGSAFRFTVWVSCGIDFLLMCVTSVTAYRYAGVNGIMNAIAGCILAFIFCESNALISVVLDKIGLAPRKYMVALIRLWIVKLIIVLLLGLGWMFFMPMNKIVFCFSVVFVAVICTLKNVIITATARVL